MLIRSATFKDAASIACINAASWQDTYRGILPQSFLDSLDPQSRIKCWEESIANNDHVLVAEVAGSIVGFTDSGAFRGKSSIAKSEIYSLYLNRAYRGQGIGRALFEACSHHFKAHGLHPLANWALADNTPACLFYKAMGGTVVEEGLAFVAGASFKQLLFVYE